MGRLAPVLLTVCLMVATACESVKRARYAQSLSDRLPGETMTTAAQLGLDASHEFTLPELERMACIWHPALLKARQAVESARQECRMTHAGRLLQLNANGAYTRQTQNSEFQRKSATTEGSWNARLGLDLLLYDFGRLDAAEKQAFNLLVAAEAQLQDVTMEVIYHLRTAFFEQHRSHHLLQVALESERQYALHLEEARTMVEVGTRRPYDATKAEVDWGNARLEIVTASNALTVAHARLNRALGLAENPVYRLSDATLPDPAATPDMLLAQARDNAPSLAVLHARARAASAYVDQTVAELYPELSLGASLDYSARHFPLVWNFSWGPRLIQNLFDGHRKTARIDAAVTQLRSARAEIVDAEQTLYLALVSSEAEVQSERKRAEIARLIRKQAEDSLAIVNEQYRVGLSSSIERTDAQVTLTEAQASVIRAEYDEQTAIARLLRQIGAPVELQAEGDDD